MDKMLISMDGDPLDKSPHPSHEMTIYQRAPSVHKYSLHSCIKFHIDEQLVVQRAASNADLDFNRTNRLLSAFYRVYRTCGLTFYSEINRLFNQFFGKTQ